jgi:hypothetical protein
MTMLQVSKAFISKWKSIYAEQGIAGLRRMTRMTRDTWNQAKACIRQQWVHLTSFLDVINAFEQVLTDRAFDFPKLHRYDSVLQMI